MLQESQHSLLAESELCGFPCDETAVQPPLRQAAKFVGFVIPPEIGKVLAILADMDAPEHACQIHHAHRHIFETGYEIGIAGEIKARHERLTSVNLRLGVRDLYLRPVAAICTRWLSPPSGDRHSASARHENWKASLPDNLLSGLYWL